MGGEDSEAAINCHKWGPSGLGGSGWRGPLPWLVVIGRKEIEKGKALRGGGGGANGHVDNQKGGRVGGGKGGVLNTPPPVLVRLRGKGKEGSSLRWGVWKY